MERLLSNQKNKIANILFYVAFFLDVLILCANNAGLEIPYRGRLLQLAAIIWGIKILLTKYSKKEWIVIVCVALVSILPFLTMRETLMVQIALMLIAAKDINRDAVLKGYFVVLLFSMLLMALLSGLGIYGEFAQIKDFDRGGVETRYCFGFSHPNVFYSNFLNVVAVGMCLFYRKMRGWHYIVLTIFNCFLMSLSASRTGFIVVQVLIVAMYIVYKWPQIVESKFVYILGYVSISLAAFCSYIIYFIDWEILAPLNPLFTGRLWLSIYDAPISEWTLLPIAREFAVIDMGFVNVMYYWGIIFGAVYLLLIFWNYRRFKIKEDYVALIILLSYTLFTMIEAHAFSMYFVGNVMFLLMIGWGKERYDVSAQKSDS